MPPPVRVLVRLKADREYLQLYYVDPLTGKDRTKSAETDIATVAARRAAEWESELNTKGQAKTDPGWDAFRLKFEDQFLKHKPYNTRLAYQAALNQWESIVGHLIRLSVISPSMMSEFTEKLGKTVAQTTVAKHLRHLRAALRWAESQEMLRQAPRIVMPKLGKRRLARSRSVTEPEYQAMLLAVDTTEECRVNPAAWKRLLDLLWLSGLRLNEALRLSWDDPPLVVDLDNGRYPRIVVHEDGQKSRQDQMVIIPPDFDGWLRATPDGERFGLVADFGNGRIVARQVATRAIAAIGKTANVRTSKTKFASAQDFRRSFGQRWARKVRPLTLQKMMRHETIETTLSYYVDIEETDVGLELWGK